MDGIFYYRWLAMVRLWGDDLPDLGLKMFSKGVGIFSSCWHLDPLFYYWLFIGSALTKLLPFLQKDYLMPTIRMSRLLALDAFTNVLEILADNAKHVDVLFETNSPENSEEFWRATDYSDFRLIISSMLRVHAISLEEYAGHSRLMHWYGMFTFVYYLSIGWRVLRIYTTGIERATNLGLW